MKLKDAIRYYELTGHDIFSDMKKQKEYMKFLMLDFDLPNDFTEVIETILDNLLVLWADSHEITDETELPSNEELVNMYLTQIPSLNSNNVVKDEIDEIIEAPSRFKKEVHENKTLDLLVSIVNSEMNLQQFYELETELVVGIMNRVQKKENKNRRKTKRKENNKWQMQNLRSRYTEIQHHLRTHSKA